MANPITQCMAPDWRLVLTGEYDIMWRVLMGNPVKHVALRPMAVLFLVLCVSALPGPAIAEPATNLSDLGGYRIMTPVQEAVCNPPSVNHFATVVCNKGDTFNLIDQTMGMSNAMTCMVDKCYNVVDSRVSAKMSHDGLLMWWKKVHWGSGEEYSSFCYPWVNLAGGMKSDVEPDQLDYAQSLYEVSHDGKKIYAACPGLRPVSRHL